MQPEPAHAQALALLLNEGVVIDLQDILCKIDRSALFDGGACRRAQGVQTVGRQITQHLDFSRHILSIRKNIAVDAVPDLSLVERIDDL